MDALEAVCATTLAVANERRKPPTMSEGASRTRGAEAWIDQNGVSSGSVHYRFY